MAPSPLKTWPFAAVAALAAGALLALACSSGGGGRPTATLPPGVTQQPSTPGGTPVASPEDALALYAQRVLSQGFVADCNKAQHPDDVGKQCAHFLRKRGDLVAYELGPTFSPATRIFILKPEGGAWTLVTTQNIDPNQPSTGIPWPIVVGSQLVVAGTAPGCLNIRAAPGTGSAQVHCINDGTAVTVVAGPRPQDDIEWWQLEGLGWAAGDYLRYPGEVPTPTATPG